MQMEMKQLKQRFANLLELSQWRLSPYQILALGFAGIILGGALLLMTPAATNGKGMSFVDALFTATSAVCVTGLVVVDTGTYFSNFGQMVIIMLIQAGGLGIMTMATLMALIMGKRINLRERLLMQEAMNQMTVSGIVRLTRYVILVTLAIEFIGGTILALRWYEEFGLRGIYYGYWHAVSSFCNAGFDLFGGYKSLTDYVDDWTVNLVITTLIILGGIGFSVLADLRENGWRFRQYSYHTKVVLVTTAFLVVCGTIGIYGLERSNPATLKHLSWEGQLLGSYFQSVTPRTAGYNTLAIGEMRDATIFFITILMFIGASPASTGGGIKTTTFAVLLAAIRALIKGKPDAELFDRHIAQNIIYKSFSLVFIAFSLVVFVTMAMSITEDAPFLNLLFEVVSAFGTVGLTTGITPGLTTAGKVWLIVTMFAGRVGPVTFVLALSMQARKTLIHYPEGKITIG